MALISPGLELSVTDESAYVPGAVGTVPLVFLATEQDKTTNGAIAAGTTKDNAAQLQVFTSQRELVSQLGAPIFKQSASGTPIHGTALNEYGLMAAYSTLGLTNRAYAIRADVNLAELEATSVRPVGKPDNDTAWLDLNITDWGLYEWNASTGQFVKKNVIVVSDPSDITPGSLGLYPDGHIGEVDDYCVVTINADEGLAQNRIYHKNDNGQWKRLGLDEWHRSHPTVSATTIGETLNLNNSIIINTIQVTLTTGTDASALASDINAAAGLTGVTAAIDRDGYFHLYADLTATSNGTDADGEINIANNTGTILTQLGIADGAYHIPELVYASYVDIPSWRASDAHPRPSGSVYIKTTAVGNGMNLVLKTYNSDTDSWAQEPVTVVQDLAKANYALDPFAGGFGIPYGTKIAVAQHDPGAALAGFAGGNVIRIMTRFVQGKMVATGQVSSPFSGGGTVSIKTTRSGFDEFFEYTIEFNSSVSSPIDWVTRFSAVGIPEVSATAKGNSITLTHETGGTILLEDIVGNMANTIFPVSEFLDDGNGVIYLTNWTFLEYQASFTTPYKAPADGTYWYYGDATTVDIMINDNGWKGYRNVASDARGYNLSTTNPTGVIVTASKPTAQTDNTALVAGDLWLDTSDLENYPKLYRYNDARQWVAIDATDRFSQNGIAFADARWDTDGSSDIVAGSLTNVADLVSSNYLDLDAPNYKLYPRGTLLWNTRRSGYNVKKFVSDYFNDDSFPDSSLPTVKSAWVSVSGLQDSGAPFMGTQAQRNMVVKAMKAAVDANTQIREEQFAYNLIVAPGFPEVIPNMVALNNDRKNTAFVIGDTPMTLPANSIAFANWANNTDGTGLSTADPYLAVYYPHGKTNDLSGNTIVVPASHMALRTYIRNDNVSYQWFAPAGVRRGLVDNASDIGYINSKTGGFVRNGINNGMRDALYENRINPFTILPGIGLVCWGQKTRNPVASSLDRVNVARLVNYIRTILASAGNAFLFEPNDKITRDQIKNVIEGALNDLIAKRGIYDYLVVCDDTNNTPTRIARNELYVDVAIEPMKAVEFIYIPIRLKNPGDIAAGL